MGCVWFVFGFCFQARWRLRSASDDVSFQPEPHEKIVCVWIRVFYFGSDLYNRDGFLTDTQ